MSYHKKFIRLLTICIASFSMNVASASITISNNLDMPSISLDIYVAGEHIENGMHDSVTVTQKQTDDPQIADTWYRIWLCKQATGNAQIKIKQVNNTPSCTYKRIIGHVKTDPQNNFLRFRQIDNIVRYSAGEELTLNADTGHDVWEALYVGNYVPIDGNVGARGVYFRVECGRKDHDGLAQLTFSMRKPNVGNNDTQRYLTMVKGFSRVNQQEAIQDGLLAFIHASENGHIYYDTAYNSYCAILLNGYML